MTDFSEDQFERMLQEALAARRDVCAPEGFAERLDARLFCARLLARQRRRLRQAWVVGLGGAAALAGVAALFIQAVDVPAWVVENVPGILGRVDAASVRLSQAAVPFLLTGVGGLAAVAAWGALRLQTRRARGRR